MGYPRILPRPKAYFPGVAIGLLAASPKPPNATAWENSVKAFQRDGDAMGKLASDPKIDLAVPITHGSGQTILREILLLADHNAYHLGQFVLLRRLLGSWKET